MKHVLTPILMVAAGPALAASGDGGFFSLRNTDFVVLLGFLVFMGILLYFKVPAMLTRALDQRAEAIRSELAEARSLREEAQTLLASYERKQKDVQAQAERIVAAAREEAERAAAEAKEDIRRSVERRLAAAEEQIASAQASAIRDVRDRAVSVAIDAARDVIAAGMTAQQANKLIDDAIATVDVRLH